MVVPFNSQSALKTLAIDADLSPEARQRLKQPLAVSREGRGISALEDEELSPFPCNVIVVAGCAALALVPAQRTLITPGLRC